MNSILNYFLAQEEQLILLEIQKNFLSNKDEIKPVSSEDIHLINANLLLTDETNVAFKVHKQLINSLICAYVNAEFPNQANELKSVFQFEEITSFEDFTQKHISEIPAIVEELHIAFLNSAFSIDNGKLTRKKSKHHLRENGAVYTLKEITNEMVENTIDNAVQQNVSPKEITCLDFASGTGRFYFEAIEILKENYNLTLQQIVCNNLFAIDVDETALSVLRCKVISLFDEINTEIINALSNNIINRNALIPKATLLEENENSIDLANDFKTVFAKGGFDVVFSNPPYCLLKVNKKADEQQKLNGYYVNLQSKVQNEINFFRTSGVYQYSIEGMLNYYQLSIEMILRLTKSNGQIGIICPSSLFADLTSAKLRKHILTSHKLHFIRYYPEAARLFENVSQSTVIFYLQKNGKTDKIGIEMSDNSFEIDFETIKNVFPTNFEIPLIDKTGWSILSKISRHKKVKDISFIRNRRGELDLTLYKPFITTENTGWRLVRGNMISENGVIDKNGEFVEIEGFLNKKSDDFKTNDYNKERLICQQISNVDMQKRLKFVFCEKTDILGNSCNYIVSTRKEEDLKKLFFILNSELLNWRFKITSSNNHINNYELDELPIVDLDSFELDDFSNNETICKLYGLTKIETNYILGNKKRKRKQYLNMNTKLYNHIAPGLSKLEWEMVQHIPEGGNWQNIPETIPSQRLEQIRRSGGRTTYYGRLEFNKPSYTITTYFNRLGNGCNLHPKQNRIISTREGARLQSFRDSFVFYGSKTSQYKQIGNAVPPLLARAIAETLKPHLKNLTFVDLFAGAGGMSEGFISEGFQLIAANEIEKNYFETYKQNHSEFDNGNNLILGDITLPEIKQQIISVASKQKKIGVVIGGPPCQGFSHAGWRNPDDKRNQLFKEFVHIVDELQPEIFVMENVPGILTMRKGEVIKEIIASFEAIGYNVNTPFKLNAEDFGVPQKRRRVVIVGTLKKEKINQPKSLFSSTNQNLPKPITVKQAIGSLPELKTGEGEFEMICNYKPVSAYEKLMSGKIDFIEFHKGCLEKLPVAFG